VLAATPFGVYASADLGARWAPVSGPLSAPPIQTLAFRPGDERVVFASTQRGLLRSDDGGRTWARLGGGLPSGDIGGLALHPDGRTLYAAGYAEHGLFRSDDSGETWRPIETEGLAASRILLLAVDPSAPERLLAGGASGGLHLLAPPQTTAIPAGARPRP
jgi:photosystem II stability/assembly factor-like uncharacterized protein